jgi:hypothetical protein
MWGAIAELRRCGIWGIWGKRTRPGRFLQISDQQAAPLQAARAGSTSSASCTRASIQCAAAARFSSFCASMCRRSVWLSLALRKVRKVLLLPPVPSDGSGRANPLINRKPWLAPAHFRVGLEMQLFFQPYLLPGARWHATVAGLGHLPLNACAEKAGKFPDLFR